MEDTRYLDERYAHQQAVLDAGMESLRLRYQRNALGAIAGLLALLTAIRWVG